MAEFLSLRVAKIERDEAGNYVVVVPFTFRFFETRILDGPPDSRIVFLADTPNIDRLNGLQMSAEEVEPWIDDIPGRPVRLRELLEHKMRTG